MTLFEDDYPCTCGHPFRNHGDRAISACWNTTPAPGQMAYPAHLMVTCIGNCTGFTLDTEQLSQMTAVDAEPIRG